jgi:hypothetical protein
LITRALLEIFFALLNTILSLLPKLSIDVSGGKNAIIYLADFIAKANMFVPIDQVFYILSIYVTIKLSLFLWWGINWIIDRIADIIP